MSVKDKKDAETVSQMMETAVDLEIPSKCDIEVGPDWGTAK